MKRKHNIELAGTLTENKIVIYGNKLSLEWISPTQILVFTRAKIKELEKCQF